MPKKKSHRHFVAAPLAALVLSISLFSGAGSATTQSTALAASVMQFSEGEVLSFPGGVQAILYSGEGFTVSEGSIVFAGGSALVASDGIAELKVAGRSLSAVSGAFHLSYHGDDLTIAALTSPVVMRKGSRLMVVPAGMQWRIADDVSLPLLQAGYPLWLQDRKVHAFSQRFLLRQLQNLAFLPEVDGLPAARTTEPMPLWSKLPTLKLGASRAEAEREWRVEVLGTLRGLIEAGDASAVSTFVMDEQHADVVTSAEAQDMVVRLLVLSSDEVLADEGLDASVRSLLLTQLITDEDLWLVASLHPDLREETWSLFSQHNNAEAHALRLFLLPPSNITGDAISASVMQRWVYELSKLAEGERAIPLVHAILAKHLPLVFRFEEQSYPERSRTLADSLTKIVENTGVSIPDDRAEEFADLKTLGRISIVEPVEEAPEVVEEVAVVEVEEEVVEESSYSPDVIESRAYTVLRDMGALFTVETAIDAVAPNTARVQGIIFPSQSGDRVVTMHFDVSEGEVDQLSVGYKEYPYALSVEAFGEWIKK